VRERAEHRPAAAVVDDGGKPLEQPALRDQAFDPHTESGRLPRAPGSPSGPTATSVSTSRLASPAAAARSASSLSDT
jgi:hypothetical protein